MRRSPPPSLALFVLGFNWRRLNRIRKSCKEKKTQQSVAPNSWERWLKSFAENKMRNNSFDASFKGVVWSAASPREINDFDTWISRLIYGRIQRSSVYVVVFFFFRNVYSFLWLHQVSRLHTMGLKTRRTHFEYPFFSLWNKLCDCSSSSPTKPKLLLHTHIRA